MIQHPIGPLYAIFHTDFRICNPDLNFHPIQSSGRYNQWRSPKYVNRHFNEQSDLHCFNFYSSKLYSLLIDSIWIESMLIEWILIELILIYIIFIDSISNSYVVYFSSDIYVNMWIAFLKSQSGFTSLFSLIQSLLIIIDLNEKNYIFMIFFI